MGIAHELITRGWVQDDFETEDGRVCLVGAIECAFLGGVLTSPETCEPALSDWTGVRDAKDALQSLIGGDIVYWNDAPERTFDEVLRVAKEADELLGL